MYNVTQQGGYTSKSFPNILPLNTLTNIGIRFISEQNAVDSNHRHSFYYHFLLDHYAKFDIIIRVLYYYESFSDIYITKLVEEHNVAISYFLDHIEL